MDKLYITMPAYNEEDNIEKVVKDWYKVLENVAKDFKFVVADSGSTDNTHNILLGLKKDFPKLEILSNTKKEHGSKLIALYKYAIKGGADYIFQTDSDGQTDSSEFNSFWAIRDKYDAILGERIDRGDGAFRKFIENVVCLLLKIYFKMDIKDANAPFRLMKTSLVNKYIDRLEDDYNIPNIMLVVFFCCYKENIIFKEISFKKRQNGCNSINFFKIIKIGIKALSDFRKLKKIM